MTYGASATFHLWPFTTVQGVTRVFVVDIMCVPFAVCGTVAPFVDASDWVREILIAVAVLLSNFVCVRWQTEEQRGLQTPPDCSDLPRSVVVAGYSVWVVVHVGARTPLSARGQPW